MSEKVKIKVDRVAPMLGPVSEVSYVAYVATGTPETRHGVLVEIAVPVGISTEMLNGIVGYGMTLKELLVAGLKDISTRPNYEKTSTQETKQALMDAYRAGARKVSIGLTEEAAINKAMAKLASTLGVSIEALPGLLAQATAQAEAKPGTGTGPKPGK